MENAKVKNKAKRLVEELQEVYAGLSDDEIAEVELVVLDRSRYSRKAAA